MQSADQDRIVHVLLKRYGTTFAEEAGIDTQLDSPGPLFSLLCVALLCSTRIGHTIALNAAKAVLARGWNTPRKLAESTWRQRVEVLDRASYVRYDERAATMLGEAGQMAIDEYGGDLRNLREKAERIPERERELLKEFKGIGDVGVGIFFREVQIVWAELFPFADPKALEAARALGLPRDAAGLAHLVRGRRRYTQLIAALVRARLEHEIESIRQAA